MFSVAERLHLPVTTVERMSSREVQAWCAYFAPPDEDDDALDLAELSPDERRAMFPGA